MEYDGSMMYYFHGKVSNHRSWLVSSLIAGNRVWLWQFQLFDHKTKKQATNWELDGWLPSSRLTSLVDRKLSSCIAEAVDLSLAPAGVMGLIRSS